MKLIIFPVYVGHFRPPGSRSCRQKTMRIRIWIHSDAFRLGIGTFLLGFKSKSLSIFEMKFFSLFSREKLSELSKLLEWPPSSTQTFDCFFVSERSCLSCLSSWSGRPPPLRTLIVFCFREKLSELSKLLEWPPSSTQTFDFFFVSERSCLSCPSCWSGRPPPPRRAVCSSDTPLLTRVRPTRSATRPSPP